MADRTSDATNREPNVSRVFRVAELVCTGCGQTFKVEDDLNGSPDRFAANHVCPPRCTCPTWPKPRNPDCLVDHPDRRNPPREIAP